MATVNGKVKTLQERGFIRGAWRLILVGTWWLPPLLVLIVSVAVGCAGGVLFGPPTDTRPGVVAGDLSIMNAETLVHFEVRTTTSSESAQPKPEWGATIENCVRSFNKGMFQTSFLVGALALALVRWTMSREEQAMDSYLAHRRAVNQLIWDSAKAVAERNDSTSEDGASMTTETETVTSEESSVEGVQEGERSSMTMEERKLSGELQHDEAGVLDYVSEAWSKDGGANALTDLFVYSELDILEMAFVKFKKAMMTPETALRMTAVMISRCGQERFRETARDLASKGKYVDGFKDAVIKIAARAVEDH